MKRIKGKSVEKYTKDFNVVEALFDQHGHFLHDIIEFRKCTTGNVNYFVPAEALSFAVEKYLISEGVTVVSFPDDGFLSSVFEHTNKQDRQITTVIFSCRYFNLIKASLKSFNWRYHLIVHFFPTQRRIFQWILLYVISLFCNGILTYDKNVSLQLNKIRIRTSGELVSRIIDVKDKSEKQIIVGVIGGSAGNIQSITPLLRCLCSKRFENIEFRFCFRGANDIKIHGENKIVIKDEYLTQEDYQEEYKKCKYIFLNYPISYGIRCSGQVLDCVNNLAYPIFSNIPTFQNYHSQFNIGVIFSDEAELLKILTEINDGTLTCPSVTPSFYEWYSLKNKIDQLNKVFK